LQDDGSETVDYSITVMPWLAGLPLQPSDGKEHPR